MNNYPLEKYRYIKTGAKIIALSTYAGKTVRGTATCSPYDKFSEEKGKKIAAARCNLKVAKKRKKRAEQQYHKALKAFSEAYKQFEKMRNYTLDVNYLLRVAEVELNTLLSDI